ncbi:alpha/beta fold hydrolase [Actinoplanes couchii]|uniref:Alpha/beta hydrolase fold n=1 Tax=Actinoplanes couchii TaxID=403638 RepID=A0ABQ3X0I3_9ACTN|nr:alpha/beta hydrolase [Actinoplanes couchii]MDR6316363.1 pimeloyl-ACP methyl ester carboxylesterase [Actinoplanes couchii]GID51977.1 alpha/beta hydrolase fold precursor [Actinoplanes couchii]
MTSLWVPTRDGRRLHATTLGDAPPTVVFEAGAAASRLSWSLVQPRVAAFARAVAYDRSGLGRSAPDPAGRTLDRMADDLNDLLDTLGPGPVILVGHSAGGPIVRLATARRPERISGLVLVDPIDEAAEVVFAESFRRNERLSLRAGTALARLGVLHLLFRSQLAVMPDDVRAEMRREAFTPQVMRTAADQARTFMDELAAWRTDPPAPGAVPVTVISGARPGGGMSTTDRAAANASHAHRAGTSPSGRHALAANSAHDVPFTDPDVIVAEIRRLIAS